MKAVILAGGLGTRLSEETDVRPKPLVEIGGLPILWHIMKIYSHYGVNEFIICLGYKGYLIKEFFANYQLHSSDVTFNISNGVVEVHRTSSENWRVSLIETGAQTMTGGRLKRVREYIGDGDFFMTYGDGVADVDLDALLAFHRTAGRLATVTAVTPPGRFGALDISSENLVTSFREKPAGDGASINGGFFVLSPAVLELIADDATVWELEPMIRLAREGQLAAYVHRGFWHAMDTLRDKRHLDGLWESGEAAWKVW